MEKICKKVIALALTLGAFASALAQTRSVDVWDFGGVAQSDAKNHISIKDLESLAELGDDGKFKASEISFGDLTVKTGNNDRSYNQGKKNYGDVAYSTHNFDDGYSADGLYYCNGKGGENTRCLILKNVKAGDVITFYARISNSGEEKIHFTSVDAAGARDGKQDEVAVIPPSATRYSYIATSSGTYKIFTEANVGKPCYYRIKRVPAVEVFGNLSSLPAGKAGLKFVVSETKQEISANVSGKSYSVGLPAGFNFTAVLSGIRGYGISPQTKNFSIEQKSASSIKKDLSVVEQKVYVASGSVTGIDKGYKIQGSAKVLFTPPKGTTYLPVEADIVTSSGAYSFKAELEPSVNYKVSLLSLNDYDVKGEVFFEGSAAFSKDIPVAAKKVYDVSGSFFGEDTVLPSVISFKNVDDGFVYEGTVSGKNYSAKLRDGSYEVICSTAKAKTSNHVTVNGNKVQKDIKLTSLAAKAKEKLPLKKDIYVGGKKADYQSVKEALDAAARMAPSSEKDRITIHIAPGVYRAQLIIDTPYITLKNDTPEQEVKLTWYYGIGYNYYSADASGYWDEDLAYDKFKKRGVAKWGVATYVKSGATAFRAEGIVFETSFNKYVTDEEIADGVENDGSINFVRKLNSDVRSKASTERSSAICVEADNAEFYKCSFLGSQDTLYTAGNVKQYFRNCYIEGNTDFIFGSGDVVFENCEISFCGYTDMNVCGYYTAARSEPGTKGYLFYNCVASADYSVKQLPGYFGRPWGPDAAVAFVNTIFSSANVIAPDGWASMSGNAPEKARFREINSLWDGKAVDLSSRIRGTVTDDSSYTPKAYFGSWHPAYYTEASSETIKLKKTSFTTDDDINTPYPGHTVTVHYTLGKADSEDMSLIQWYSTKGGKKTLVKQSAGYADKTYLLQKSDSGATITCVVTPMLRGGKPQKSVTAKLDATVKEGYAVPAKAASVKARTAGAVNVFLASDSTCKDYSSSGMWSAGQTRNEGSWGEFLQCWFNGAVSVQNYANGGRSSRNFINEGSLAAIEKNIGKGDYLFIQFGHNDCSNGAGYLEDRYVPLGESDKKGIYPVTAGKKVPTPASYVAKYGNQFYSYDCGGTYKWYLKQYVDVAKKAGAIPVLVTPVSRLYFGSDGKISPHHDSKDTSTKTQTTKNNAYVEAVRQLAKEENVILLDGFEFTKALYEKAYADKKNKSEAEALMNEGESTHNNKLGGFILAGEFAKAIKAKIPALGKSLVHPVKAIGENADGSLMFTVDSNGKFNCKDAYWTEYEQKVMDSFGK